MQRLLFLIALLSSTSLYSVYSQNTWPGKEYKYVVAYAYNFESDFRRNYLIVKDGQTDSTIVGEGVRLSPEQAEQICAITNKDIRGLLSGLSKTFMPHHAFVFYDDNDSIVAHMSIGLECEGIKVFPEIEYKEFTEEISSKEMKLCMHAIEVYAEIIKNTGLPVYQTLEEYRNYPKDSK